MKYASGKIPCFTVLWNHEWVNYVSVLFFTTCDIFALFYFVYDLFELHFRINRTQTSLLTMTMLWLPEVINCSAIKACMNVFFRVYVSLSVFLKYVFLTTKVLNKLTFSLAKHSKINILFFLEKIGRMHIPCKKVKWKINIFQFLFYFIICFNFLFKWTLFFLP